MRRAGCKLLTEASAGACAAHTERMAVAGSSLQPVLLWRRWWLRQRRAAALCLTFTTLLRQASVGMSAAPVEDEGEQNAARQMVFCFATEAAQRLARCNCHPAQVAAGHS